LHQSCASPPREIVRSCDFIVGGAAGPGYPFLTDRPSVGSNRSKHAMNVTPLVTWKGRFIKSQARPEQPTAK